MSLAQLNIARLRFPLDGPELKDFVDGLPEINALGDSSPGFVWRLTDEGGADATALRPFEDRDDILINMSVWESLESLRDFIYHTKHLEYMRRRREWFDHNGLEAYAVLWWVPQGHIPTLAEGKERLEHLIKHGPTPEAFTFRDPR
jgi:Domain of unknown function (DUF3291)